MPASPSRWMKRTVLGLATVATLGAVGAANADAFSDYEKNIQAFAEQAQTGQALPRFSDKNTAALIRQLTDQKRVLDRIDFNNDLVSMRAMQGPCANANQLLLTYLSHGVNLSDSNSDRVMEGLNRNGQIYQDEVSAIQSFSLSCMSHVMPTMVRYFQNSSPAPEDMSEEQRTGIVLFRKSIVQSLSGTLTAIQDPSVKPANREMLLKSMLTAMPNIARVLPLDTRGQLKAAVDEAKTNIPVNQQHYIDKINRALTNAPCQKVCQIVITP